MAALAGRRPWATTPRPGGTKARPAGRRPVFPPTPVLAGAACAGADPELFFPEGDDPGTEAQAKAICQRCPVRSRCLDGAVARRETYGIWGGVNFAVTRGRAAGTAPRPDRPGPMPRNLPPMDKAAWLGRLRAEHHTLGATARAAGVCTETARFYLDLLELDVASQARVRAGTLTAATAVAAVRATRGGRPQDRRAS